MLSRAHTTTQADTPIKLGMTERDAWADRVAPSHFYMLRTASVSSLRAYHAKRAEILGRISTGLNMLFPREPLSIINGCLAYACEAFSRVSISKGSAVYRVCKCRLVAPSSVQEYAISRELRVRLPGQAYFDAPDRIVINPVGLQILDLMRDF